MRSHILKYLSERAMLKGKFVGYKIVYQERDQNFRRTGISFLLKRIAEFSSDYFVLDSSLNSDMYKVLYNNARVDRENEMIKNSAFVYDRQLMLMNTYMPLMPSDGSETIDLFIKLTDDYPQELYKLSSDICSAYLQVFEIQ